MTLTFPLSVADFAATLRVADRRFVLSEALELSEGGDGAIATADYGPRLWTGTYQLSRMHLREAEALQALIEQLTYADRTFEASDPVLTGPAADPDGALLGAATPSLKNILNGGRTIRIQGLPVQYPLTRGDRLTVVDANGKVGLHRIANDAVAGGAGNTDDIDIAPALRLAAAIGDPVTLLRPWCLAMIKPGSFRPGRPRGVHVQGIAFDWVEVL